MTELENVLYALRCRVIGAPSTCTECSYYDAKWCCCNTKYIMKDALVLLQNQEARVMSFNELEFDTVYWIELKDVMPWPVAMARMRGNPEYLVFVDYHGDEWDVSKYRIKEGGWRLWTSRPTPEQMRETPWEVKENG